MRIIRAASKVKEAVLDCPNCGSILGIEEDDIRYMDMCYKVFCPVCENWFGDLNKNVLFPWKMEGEKNENETSKIPKIL